MNNITAVDLWNFSSPETFTYTYIGKRGVFHCTNKSLTRYNHTIIM